MSYNKKYNIINQHQNHNKIINYKHNKNINYINLKHNNNNNN